MYDHWTIVADHLARSDDRVSLEVVLGKLVGERDLVHKVALADAECIFAKSEDGIMTVRIAAMVTLHRRE